MQVAKQDGHMQRFARRLRNRARQLGLSDAEVARRAGLTERRYAHYVAGTREPNLATLVSICEVLDSTPSEMLLESTPDASAASERDVLLARIMATSKRLDVEALRIAALQLSAFIQGRTAKTRRTRG